MSKTQVVKVKDIEIGGGQFVAIAGPCSIESQSQLDLISECVKNSQAKILRGGIYKMRTSPDAFQGLEHEAFNIVKAIKDKHQMPFVSEVTDPRQIEELYELVDMFQVGSRNMYNYSLLKELANFDKPVLLKRGFSALYDEWIKAASYVTSQGNAQVVLCERGIRTFESATRNTLDLNSVAYIKENTDLPIIVDPSHGTGVRNLVTPMALASAAAGADGIMVEVHNNPEKAQSDGFQALTPEMFDHLMKRINTLTQALRS